MCSCCIYSLLQKEVIKAAIQAGFGEKDENGEVIYIDEEIDGKKVSTPKGITTIEEPFAAAYSYGYKNGFLIKTKRKTKILWFMTSVVELLTLV